MFTQQPKGFTGEDPFFNRELSWIEFNRRVLHEALERKNPLLERLKFVSIVSSNFDEFFMVRVATIKRHIRQGNRIRCPSGIPPSDLLKEIERKIREIIALQHKCLEEELLPGMEENGLAYVYGDKFSSDQLQNVYHIFEQEIFLNLTPVRVEPEETFPFTNSLLLHILFKLHSVGNDTENNGPVYAIVQIPSVLPRIRWLPSENGVSYFTLQEDIIIENAGKLFPGYQVDAYLFFRITRDADLSVDEERDEDFVEAMEEVLIHRQYSLPVRLEMTSHSEELQEFLIKQLSMSHQDVYTVPHHLDLRTCMELVNTKGFECLRYTKWNPCRPRELPQDVSIWDAVKRNDVLLHHPYESFDPIVNIVSRAAEDPKVMTIKMTLYRTSGDSPIIKALIRAANNGKQVTAMVELKARFDEEQNISWSNQLEKAGVIVIYGIAHLKVHAKALLIVRREREGIRRYVHMGTGNYNDKTAKLYTDFSYLTSREDISFEIAQFFNAVTGYSSIPNLNKLVMSPLSLKKKLLTLIKRETDRSTPDTPGLVMGKMNSLSDPDIIRALYNASRKGVAIRLNIRGICLLVPGMEGTSETISIVSIVDRFLEHSRVFYFYNQGDSEVYLSSADWMPRNLERRIELMWPVPEPRIQERLREGLDIFFADNTKSWILQSDGSYIKRVPAEGIESVRAQQRFYEIALEEDRRLRSSPTRDFVVRRNPPENYTSG